MPKTPPQSAPVKPGSIRGGFEILGITPTPGQRGRYYAMRCRHCNARVELRITEALSKASCGCIHKAGTRTMRSQARSNVAEVKSKRRRKQQTGGDPRPLGDDTIRCFECGRTHEGNTLHCPPCRDAWWELVAEDMVEEGAA